MATLSGHYTAYFDHGASYRGFDAGAFDSGALTLYDITDGAYASEVLYKLAGKMLSGTASDGVSGSEYIGKHYRKYLSGASGVVSGNGGGGPSSWDIRDDTGGNIKNNQNGWALHSSRPPTTDTESPTGEWNGGYGGLGDSESYLFRYHSNSGLDAATQWTIEFDVKYDSLDTYASITDGHFGVSYYTGTKRYRIFFFADSIYVRSGGAWVKATDYTPDIGNYETYRITLDATTNACHIYQDGSEIWDSSFSDNYAGLADQLYIGGYYNKADANTVDWHLQTFKVASGIHAPGGGGGTTTYHEGLQTVLASDNQHKDVSKMMSGSAIDYVDIVDSTASAGGAGGTASASASVPSGGYDARESAAGHVYTTGVLLYVGESSGDLYSAFIINPAIPQGATVTSADFRYYSYNVSNTAGVKLRIYGEATGDATLFTGGFFSYELSNRPTTTNYTDWEYTTVTPHWETVDVTDIVNEIVNYGDWSSENNMNFIVYDNGSNNVYSTVYAYEHTDNVPAELIIYEYATGGVTYTENIYKWFRKNLSGDPTVAIEGRFEDPPSWNLLDSTGDEIYNDQENWADFSYRAPYSYDEDPAGVLHLSAGASGDSEAWAVKYNSVFPLATDKTLEFKVKFDGESYTFAESSGSYFQLYYDVWESAAAPNSGRHLTNILIFKDQIRIQEYNTPTPGWKGYSFDSELATGTWYYFRVSTEADGFSGLVNMIYGTDGSTWNWVVNLHNCGSAQWGGNAWLYGPGIYCNDANVTTHECRIEYVKACSGAYITGGVTESGLAEHIIVSDDGGRTDSIIHFNREFDDGVEAASDAWSPVETIAVTASDRDAHERSDGAGAYTSTAIWAGNTGGYTWMLGMQFTPSSIPASAVITTAYITYGVQLVIGDPTLRIYCEDTDDAVAFDGTNNDISSRTLTTAYADWEPESADTVTVDITDPIQEVVNRATYTSGGTLDVIIKDNGSAAGDYIGIYSYDHTIVTEPRLTVYWESDDIDKISKHVRKKLDGDGISISDIVAAGKNFLRWITEKIKLSDTGVAGHISRSCGWVKRVYHAFLTIFAPVDQEDLSWSDRVAASGAFTDKDQRTASWADTASASASWSDVSQQNEAWASGRPEVSGSFSDKAQRSTSWTKKVDQTSGFSDRAKPTASWTSKPTRSTTWTDEDLPSCPPEV